MAELSERLQSLLGTAYRLEKELGGGGMSRVFVAEETRLARRVVIKVLPPELAAEISVDRFNREIQLSASLQHPHIVPLLAAGGSADVLFYTMPFVEGEALRTRLAREGELPVRDAVRILKTSPTRSPTHTRAASCTATSSPTTSSSPATTPSSPISASRKPSARRKGRAA